VGEELGHRAGKGVDAVHEGAARVNGHEQDSVAGGDRVEGVSDPVDGGLVSGDGVDPGHRSVGVVADPQDPVRVGQEAGADVGAIGGRETPGRVELVDDTLRVVAGPAEATAGHQTAAAAFSVSTAALDAGDWGEGVDVWVDARQAARIGHPEQAVAVGQVDVWRPALPGVLDPVGHGIDAEQLSAAHVSANPYRSRAKCDAFRDARAAAKLVELDPVHLPPEPDVHLHQVIRGGDPQRAAMDREGRNGFEVPVHARVARGRGDPLQNGSGSGVDLHVSGRIPVVHPEVPARKDRIGGLGQCTARDIGDLLAGREVDQHRARAESLVRTRSAADHSRHHERAGGGDQSDHGCSHGPTCPPRLGAPRTVPSRRCGHRGRPRGRNGCRIVNGGRGIWRTGLPGARGWSRHGARRRRPKRWILLEDALLEVPKRRAGVDAEFVCQGASGPVEGVERLALPPGPVQGQHQLAPQRLPERVSGDQIFQFADHLEVASGGQLGLDALLHRAQPGLLQAPDLALGERHMSQILERRAPEQRDPVAQSIARGRVLSTQRHPGPSEQRLEAVQVEFAGLHPQPIPGRVRREPGAAFVVRQHPSQPRDVGLERGLRGRWRRTAP
jgi:hypothetical protein